MKQIIHDTMRNLGITRNYRGYYQLFVCVELALEDENRMMNITNEIYRPAAKFLNCNYFSIERNIRTVINRVWRTNQKLLLKHHSL